MSDPYTRGYEANRFNVALDANPYTSTSYAARRWQDGWHASATTRGATDAEKREELRNVTNQGDC